MTDTKQTTAPVPVRDDAEGPVAVRPELAAAVETMLGDVPEAGGDAIENIIGAIIRTSDVRDLDAPWRTAGLRELVNQPIVIHAIRKAPSDYRGGLPFFLLIDGAYQESGEVFTVTSGAASVVVQLAKAWSSSWFPLRCVPRESAKPSKAGYYPMHLEIIP